MIDELKEALEAHPDNPFLQGHVGALSAVDCSPYDLRVRDADATEIFIVDQYGQRYSGASFGNLKSAHSWVSLQKNGDSLRVAITAKFILENADVVAPPPQRLPSKKDVPGG
jgi:hypothetical protein